MRKKKIWSPTFFKSYKGKYVRLSKIIVVSLQDGRHFELFMPKFGISIMRRKMRSAKLRNYFKVL